MKVVRISGVALVDKDVIIRAYIDLGDGTREIFRMIILDGFNGVFTPVITNQILYELLYDLKSVYRLDDERIDLIVDGLIASERWVKIDYRSSTVERAKDLVSRYTITPSTALLIATMEEYNIKRIVSLRRDIKIYPFIEVIDPLK